MPRLSDIRIGTKLTAISGLSILLVLVLLAAQIWSNATVKSANEAANVRQRMARDLMAVQAALRHMQLAARDVRLASSREVLQSALKALEERRKVAHRWLDPLTTELRIAENRERIAKLGELVDQYAANTRDLGKMRDEAISLEGRDWRWPMRVRSRSRSKSRHSRGSDRCRSQTRSSS